MRPHVLWVWICFLSSILGGVFAQLSCGSTNVTIGALARVTGKIAVGESPQLVFEACNAAPITQLVVFGKPCAGLNVTNVTSSSYLVSCAADLSVAAIDYNSFSKSVSVSGAFPVTTTATTSTTVNGVTTTTATSSTTVNNATYTFPDAVPTVAPVTIASVAPSVIKARSLAAGTTGSSASAAATGLVIAFGSANQTVALSTSSSSASINATTGPSPVKIELLLPFAPAALLGSTNSTTGNSGDASYNGTLTAALLAEKALLLRAVLSTSSSSGGSNRTGSGSKTTVVLANLTLSPAPAGGSTLVNASSQSSTSLVAVSGLASGFLFDPASTQNEVRLG